MASKTGTKGYSPRPGELRIGDCLRLPGDAPFVLFGIAEDLGIRTNGGRAGAAKTPEGIFPSTNGCPRTCSLGAEFSTCARQHR